jgi:hypothetical protein
MSDAHPNDSNPAPLDPNFVGFAELSPLMTAADIASRP